MPISDVAAQGSKRIIDEEPYDQLTLDASNDNAVIKVRPIPFPERRLPDKPKSSDKLRVQLLDDARDFEVAWKNVTKVELFEQLVIDEMLDLTSEGKLDEAYDYLLFMRTKYPLAEGLDAAHRSFLYQSAGAAFRKQQYAEALGIVEELYRRDPDYRASDASPTIMQVLGSTADKLIDGYVQTEDYATARTLLNRLVKQYSASKESFAIKWRTQLTETASQKRNEARSHLEAERFTAAYDAFAEMQNIWPDVEGGAELAVEMAQRYPLVRVGVFDLATSNDPRSLENPAARRTGRLVERRLLEFQGMGPEGGFYSSPYGSFERSDDGMQLTFRLHRLNQTGPGTQPAKPFTGYDLSQLLLSQAATEPVARKYTWQRLIGSVSVKDVWQVDINLREAHVLPQALLQDVRPPKNNSAGSSFGEGPYVVHSQAENEIRFVTNPRYRLAQAGQPAEIVERIFDDPNRAILALKRGEIDVLDRIFPGDIPEIQNDKSLVIDTRSVPTSHFLIFQGEHPYLRSRTFRRSLAYGLDRQLILDQAILKGAKLSGFRLTSAPFPAPLSSGDLVAYGYDDRIEPRPFQPRLAWTLKVLGMREVATSYEKREETLPPLTPLTLGHPADEVSRIACRAIVAQWKRLGIECKLVEFGPGVVRAESKDCDLVYVQACVCEPVVDASRLFGAHGLTPADNPFIQLGLRQIGTASNWQVARQRHQDLHRIVHEDVTVLPLWQMNDYFAYKKQLQGVGSQLTTLYQNVEQWRVTTQFAGK